MGNTHAVVTIGEGVETVIGIGTEAGCRQMVEGKQGLKVVRNKNPEIDWETVGPELLEALEGVLWALHYQGSMDRQEEHPMPEMEARAKQIIAKAKGES